MVRMLFFSVIAVLVMSGTALVGQEVHIVAVGKGQPPDDLYALPEAHVLVDRPGQNVSLILLGGGPLRWKVETTPDTFVDGIFMGGRVSRDSEVLLSGIPMIGTRMPDLPLVYRPVGKDFRAMVEQLTQDLATHRIHSFQSQHVFRGAPMTIDQVDLLTPAFGRNPLSAHVGATKDLPVELKHWLETGAAEGSWEVVFDPSGFTLGNGSGATRFPVPESMPDILLPVQGTYDPQSQTLFGVTYGGEGVIYAVDTLSGDWSIIAGLDGYDAATLHFDARDQVLVLTGAFSRPGEIKIVGLDGSKATTMIPITSFPGLTDLFDFGNEYGPPLTPLMYRDGWLLLEALGTEQSRYPHTGPYRLYAVEIETGDVRLLRYRDD
ncbi:hypothetical protein [Actibacterium atlanticum]|nr:hypothetical protein [Actibacterium atlanticum]